MIVQTNSKIKSTNDPFLPNNFWTNRIIYLIKKKKKKKKRRTKLLEEFLSFIILEISKDKRSNYCHFKLYTFKINFSK